MNDGKAVHVLYNTEYTGLAYYVLSKNIEPMGLMRVYTPHTNEWNYVELDKERDYIKQIKSYMGEVREIGFENNPYGVYGSISLLDHLFRVHLDAAPGMPRKRGMICTSFKLPQIMDIYMNKLHYLPDPNPKFINLDDAELRDKIKNIAGLGKYKKNIDALSRHELASLLTLMTFSIEERCENLKQVFSDKKLLFEI
jgi:hypothetical protein